MLRGAHTHTTRRTHTQTQTRMAPLFVAGYSTMAAAAADATADAFSVLPAEVLVCVAQKLPVLERRHLPAVCQRLRALSRSGRFWSYGDDSSVRLVYSSTDRLKVLVKFLSSLEGPITWRSLELEMQCCVSGFWAAWPAPLLGTACAAAGDIMRRCWGP